MDLRVLVSILLSPGRAVGIMILLVGFKDGWYGIILEALCILDAWGMKALRNWASC